MNSRPDEYSPEAIELIRNYRVHIFDISSDPNVSDVEFWHRESDAAFALACDLMRLRSHPEKVNDCPYTHSHTRHWCGYPMCRDS